MQALDIVALAAECSDFLGERLSLAMVLVIEVIAPQAADDVHERQRFADPSGSCPTTEDAGDFNALVRMHGQALSLTSGLPAADTPKWHQRPYFMMVLVASMFRFAPQSSSRGVWQLETPPQIRSTGAVPRRPCGRR